jgi:hypothetical protein
MMRAVTVLVDARGIAWGRSENYQEQDATAPGWLELRSDGGELRTYAEVVESFGYRDGRVVDQQGEPLPYLLGYLEGR